MQSPLKVTLPSGTLTTPPIVDEAPPLPAHPSTLATFDRLYIAAPHRWLVALLVAYLIAAVGFARYTPAWQAPDEPAHYNYIAHIAEGKGLPVLEYGDYDQRLLEQLLDSKFSSKFPIENVQYESYQPPLYYLLATPVYWASGGSLLALRLFGVLLGAVGLLLLYLCLIAVFPGKSLIPLGAVAFTALLPMHLAMSAAVNNDGLAEVLLLAAFLVLLHWMRRRFYGRDVQDERRRLVWLGVLLGLGMLTKIYAYLALPVILWAIWMVVWLQPRVQSPTLEATHLRPSRSGLRQGLGMLVWVLVPALLVALPLWVRNVLVYGLDDPLGMVRHDQVVIGQARTADWIARNGWLAYGERAMGFTFKSFWGVFGWMGVFMDERIYTALLIFTGVIFMGVLWATVRFISGSPDTDMDLFQLSVLIFFGILLGVVTLSYFGYNMKFMQHQGRYFFWGLLPISTIVALGWREVLQPLQGAITGFLATVLAVAMVLSGTVTGTLNKWTGLSISLFALILLVQPLLLGGSKDTLRWLPRRVKRWLARPVLAAMARVGRTLVWALPFILLLCLDLLIPFWFIQPQLGR